MNPWIQTYTGAFFDLRTMSPVNVEDIAHALSQINRYTGHTRWPYSVAQHCVLMSRWIDDPAFALEALVHDGHEAYVGDVSSPLKKLIPDFKEVDQRAEAAVRRRFDLPEKMSPKVIEADLRMLITERRDLLGPKPQDWSVDAMRLVPYEHKIPEWSAVFAERAWLRRLKELT